MGDILLLRNFNARTKDEQTMFDTNEVVYGEVMEEEVCLKRQQAPDMSAITEYGKHFLALRSALALVLYNGLSQCPGSNTLTCGNPNGDVHTIFSDFNLRTMGPTLQL